MHDNFLLFKNPRCKVLIIKIVYMNSAIGCLHNLVLYIDNVYFRNEF